MNTRQYKNLKGLKKENLRDNMSDMELILNMLAESTSDTQYKAGLLSLMDKAYQVQWLFLKDEAKDFWLVKEMRNLDFDGMGERETLAKVYQYFKEKYNLGSNKQVNRENLEAGGDIISAIRFYRVYSERQMKW